MRGFLTLIGYYRRFVKGYENIVTQWTKLLQKNLKWDEGDTKAFESLKQIMIFVLILALPDFSLTFTIETNASGIGLVGILFLKRTTHSVFQPKIIPSCASNVYLRDRTNGSMMAVKK